MIADGWVVWKPRGVRGAELALFWLALGALLRSVAFVCVAVGRLASVMVAIVTATLRYDSSHLLKSPLGIPPHVAYTRFSSAL